MKVKKTVKVWIRRLHEGNIKSRIKRMSFKKVPRELADKHRSVYA